MIICRASFQAPGLMVIRFFDHLYWVKHLVINELIKLDSTAQAICGNHFSIQRLYSGDQPARNLDRLMIERLLERQNACFATAIMPIDCCYE